MVALIVVAPIGILYAIMINGPPAKPQAPDELDQPPVGVQPGSG